MLTEAEEHLKYYFTQARWLECDLYSLPGLEYRPSNRLSMISNWSEWGYDERIMQAFDLLECLKQRKIPSVLEAAIYITSKDEMLDDQLRELGGNTCILLNNKRWILDEGQYFDDALNWSFDSDFAKRFKHFLKNNRRKYVLGDDKHCYSSLSVYADTAGLLREYFNHGIRITSLEEQQTNVGEGKKLRQAFSRGDVAEVSELLLETMAKDLGQLQLGVVSENDLGIAAYLVAKTFVESDDGTNN